METVKMTKMTTLDDIAKLCGVSPSTVSRVLNNEPGISQDTRENVMRICEENSFTVQRRKRPLKRAQLNLMIVIPDEAERTINPFFDIKEVLNAINSNFADEKKKIEILSFDDFSVQALEETFHSDGIILAFGSPGDEALKKLRAKNIPFVFLNRDFPGENYVCANNIKGMLKLGLMLSERGYSRVGYLGCSSKMVNRDRYRGYQIARLEGGYEPDPALVVELKMVKDIDENTVEAFRKTGCDAVMCFNDNFAVRFINEMQEMGLNVPHDLAVTGFDCAPVREIFKPKLTTVNLSTYELGFFASRWLRDIILHRMDRTLHLEVEGDLVEGNTVEKKV